MAAKWMACVVLALCVAAAAAQIRTDRLREHRITLEARKPQNLLGIPVVDPPTRVSGYFKLARTYAAEMFYFYFEARHRPESAPVVLWMTGGPGCSSELAVLFENGPYTLTANGTLEENEFGWDTYHHMIYVDQPINTGFSYSDDPRDRVYGEDMVGEDMLDFLRAFYQARPELQELPLYITGESYAGHYVPAVAHRVFLANKNQEGPAINFKGLAIGNGLTNPAIQFNAYGDFALQNGLISSMTRSVMSFLFPLCSIASTLCDSTNWSWLCDLGVNYCMSTQFQPILVANPDINVYDILRKCDGPLCYDFSAADSFLNSKATQKALGVDKPWVSCDMDVYQDFTSDWLHRFDSVLPDMLADGIRVQIYAGDLDLICNYLGNRRQLTGQLPRTKSGA